MDKEHWAKVNIVLRKTPNGMGLTEVPLPTVPAEIKKILEED